METPKIIYIVTSSISIGLMRGQLNFLGESGFEVTVISSPGKELNVIEHAENVSIHPVKMAREISLFQDLFSLIHLIFVLIKIRPQLINVGTPKAGLLGSIAGWITRVPIRIYTLHGLRLETTRGVKRFILRLTEKIACACSHKVLCVSHSLRDKVVELGIVNKDKAIILGSGSNNGLNTNRFKSTTLLRNNIRFLRKELNIRKNEPIIGFVGRMTKDKGLNELIHAFNILKETIPRLRLLLIGDFEQSDMPSAEVISQIQQDPNIIFTGFIHDPIPYYYLMDIFVFPTYREGLGNVSLEAAAAGKPVITTNATGAIDTVIDGETGYIVPVGHVPELANRIRELLHNPSMCKQLGINGRKRIVKEFRAEEVWQKLKSLYHDLLHTVATLRK